MDSLINCNKCNSDACYVEEVTADIKTFFCYGCGFQSSSLMKDSEEFYDEQLKSLPELYKDLIYNDGEKNWMPTLVNLPQQGMIFANGVNKLDWKWSAVKAIPVTDEDKIKYPIPGKEGEFYEWRMDMTTMENFEERDFMEALSYIGVLPE